MNGRAAVLILVLLCAAGFAVAQPPVTITTGSPLPTGYLNLPYGPPPSFQGLQFTATTNPSQASVTWSIMAGGGNPPPGLGITSSGFFSGSPTATGDFSFTVGAVTPYGSSTQTYTLHVATPQITLTSPAILPSGSVNQPYSFTFTATENPPLGLSWFIDNPLPNGVFLNQATGQIAGTPTQFGTFPLAVTALMNGTNFSATGNFTLNIYAGVVTILTTTLPVAPIGQAYSVTLQANPLGVTWNLAGSTLPPGFSFDTTTGILSGGGSAPGTYRFAVNASYPNYITANATFTLYVTNGPLSILENSLPIAIQNVAYRTTVTPVGGLGPFTWAVAQNALGFTIDPNNAIISGTPTLPPGTSYPLSVTVSDAAGERYTQPYSVFVAAPLSITTTSLPNGTVGAPYVQALTAAGGQAPYVWLSLTTPGPFPPGLALGTDGVIRGTPTTNGVYPITVQVTDFGKRTATATLSITVGAPVTLSIGPNSLPDGQPSIPYPPPNGGGVQLTATGGTAPYIFSTTASALPQGLSLSSTGLISGTPVGPPQAPLGTSTFTVTVHDTSSLPSPLTGSKTYTLNITLPLTMSTTSLPNGTIGIAYPQTALQASGGQPPYNFSVASGALPPGLNLDPASGNITGKPTGPAQVSTFTILLQDAGAQTVQRQFSITIAAAGTPPSITTGDASGTVGTAFSVTLAATGGTAPYTFALTSGTPPAGLSFANGVLSGTPTAPGTTALGFTVTDAQKQTATKTINITINLPPPPPASIAPIPPNPATQPNVTLSLTSAYPVAVIGTLSLSFQSAVGGSPSEVQFLTTAGGSQTASVLIPAGQLTGPSVPLITGTVAGTITITTKLSAAGVDVTPTPAPTQTIVIKPAAPVIQSVAFSNAGGTVTVTVIGYSTTREVVSGDFVFAVATGNTVSNGGDVPVTLGSAFTTWYASSASNPFGGQFKLTLPFTVANGTSTSVTSVSVKLTNTVGTSAVASPQ
jgi:Putative Ig domain